MLWPIPVVRGENTFLAKLPEYIKILSKVKLRVLNKILYLDLLCQSKYKKEN